MSDCTSGILMQFHKTPPFIQISNENGYNIVLKLYIKYINTITQKQKSRAYFGNQECLSGNANELQVAKMRKQLNYMINLL